MSQEITTFAHAFELLSDGLVKDKKFHVGGFAEFLIDIWSQGYSEPNSGSDLGSLQTRAVDHGDLFIVNGANHNNILLYSHDNYFNRINAFIQSI